MIRISVVKLFDEGQETDSELNRQLQTLKETEAVCQNKEDISGGAAEHLRNSLLSAKGKYVYFMTHGDRFTSASDLEEMYDIAEAEDAELIRYGECEPLQKIECGHSVNGANQNRHDYLILNREQMPEVLRLSRKLSGGLYRKDLFESVIWDFETDYSSTALETVYWQLAAKAAKAVIINPNTYEESQNNTAGNDYQVNPEDIYEVNRKYDFIKDILMDNENPDTWGVFRNVYTDCKLRDYLAALKRLEPGQRRVFWERFFREIRRSFSLGEVSRAGLTAESRGIMNILLEYPDDYYASKAEYDDRIKHLNNEVAALRSTEAKLNSIISDRQNQIHTLQERIEALENSTSFKVGSAVTFFPRHIKDTVKKQHE